MMGLDMTVEAGIFLHYGRVIDSLHAACDHGHGYLLHSLYREYGGRYASVIFRVASLSYPTLAMDMLDTLPQFKIDERFIGLLCYRGQLQLFRRLHQLGLTGSNITGLLERAVDGYASARGEKVEESKELVVWLCGQYPELNTDEFFVQAANRGDLELAASILPDQSATQFWQRALAGAVENNHYPMAVWLTSHYSYDRMAYQTILEETLEKCSLELSCWLVLQGARWEELGEPRGSAELYTIMFSRGLRVNDILHIKYLLLGKGRQMQKFQILYYHQPIDYYEYPSVFWSLCFNDSYEILQWWLEQSEKKVVLPCETTPDYTPRIMALLRKYQFQV